MPQRIQRECWHGRNCSRYQCYFQHPDGRESQDCTLGSGCFDPYCGDLHPRARVSNTSRTVRQPTRGIRNVRSCRYGYDCHRYDCWFSHPGGRHREPCRNGMDCTIRGCMSLHPRGYVAPPLYLPLWEHPNPTYARAPIREPEPHFAPSRYSPMSLLEEEDLDAEFGQYNLFISILRALSFLADDDDVLPPSTPSRPVVVATRERAALALQEAKCVPFIPEGLKDCVVCLDSPYECCLVKCGHVCVCMECVNQLQSPICPLCRTPITHVLPTRLLNIDPSSNDESKSSIKAEHQPAAATPQMV